MGIEDNEFEIRLKLISQLNFNMVMDQARADAGLMTRIVDVLEERGVDARSDEEKAFLERARSFQRLQGIRHD
ncbi:hypothetical protein [Pseudomonas oryzihabitans]|uniref:hypothetical protein n=1 Tax=Pseudomonas oryzihabitans TaxID=47885 RepID=UPI0011A82F63|nr:hypothetical protein [Pseudomonas oryzihabitans]QEU01935.1 hypothetical protein FOB65_00945 [Pseudomonas oryzihabitans]